MTIYCVAEVSATGQKALVTKDVGNRPGSYEFDLNTYNTSSGAAGVGPDFGNGPEGSTVGTTFEASPSGNPVGAAHVFAVTRTFVQNYTNSYAAGLPSAVTNWYYTSSNTVSLYLDGVQTVTNASLNEGAPGTFDGGEPTYIGERNDHAAIQMNGQIMEILLFNTPLSGADMTNVDNYLGAKWFNGVTFVTGVPTITTSNGFAVTLSPGPSSGSSHLSGLQWQENGTNIPGATGASYTTPILAPSDNGDTFSLVVTLSTGVSYTNTTTLDVLNEPPYVTSAGLPLWNLTNNIVVLFDEAVTPATATVAANYTLNNGASVLSAAMGNTPNEVVLTTSALTWSENPGFYQLTVTNVEDVYGNTNVPQTIAVGLYPPGVALWIKASTGVTAANGNNGAVSQWNDLSGNGNNLSVISATDPLLTNGAFGDTVVRFTGINNANFPQMYASQSASLAIVGDMTIAAVVNFATLAGGTNGEIVSKTGAGAQANIPAPYDCYVNGTPSELLYRGNGGSGGNGVSYGQVTATIGPSAGVPHILVATESGNTVSFFLDGQPAGSASLSSGYQETSDADAMQALFIGGRGDNHNRLTGDIFEMAVVGSGMSTNDVLALENYLGAEYSVPVAPNTYPAITQQPVASTNVFEGYTLTVAAAASGVPAVAYQWYGTNNAAVAGQTSATLVIPNIQTTNSYYLVATNMYGSVTSSVVNVNVIPVNSNPTNILFSVTNNQLTLNWPADHTGWTLQVQTNSLSVGLGTNWLNVSSPTPTNKVIIPINLTNGSVFYRLVYP